MRFRFLASGVFSAFLLTSCFLSPSGPETPNGSAVLRLQPEIREGGYRLQAEVVPYAPKDVARLVLTLYRLDAEGRESAVTRPGGAPLTQELSQDQLSEPVDFSGLHPATTYRIKAEAYADEAKSDRISRHEDGASQLDVAIERDDRPTLATLTVPLKDKPFDGQGSTTVAIATGSLVPSGPESISIGSP